MIDVPALVALWTDYAEHGRAQAEACRQAGDLFGANLAEARRETRADAAAVLASRPDPLDAARSMIAEAVRHSVRLVPLVDFDQAFVSYVRARTWQDCARSIDPSLPEIQARWD